MFEPILYNQLGKYMDTFLDKEKNYYVDLEKPTLLSMLSLSYYSYGRRNLITLG